MINEGLANNIGVCLDLTEEMEEFEDLAGVNKDRFLIPPPPKFGVSKMDLRFLDASFLTLGVLTVVEVKRGCIGDTTSINLGVWFALTGFGVFFPLQVLHSGVKFSFRDDPGDECSGLGGSNIESDTYFNGSF